MVFTNHYIYMGICIFCLIYLAKWISKSWVQLVLELDKGIRESFRQSNNQSRVYIDICFGGTAGALDTNKSLHLLAGWLMRTTMYVTEYFSSGKTKKQLYFCKNTWIKFILRIYWIWIYSISWCIQFCAADKPHSQFGHGFPMNVIYWKCH